MKEDKYTSFHEWVVGEFQIIPCLGRDMTDTRCCLDQGNTLISHGSGAVRSNDPAKGSDTVAVSIAAGIGAAAADAGSYLAPAVSDAAARRPGAAAIRTVASAGALWRNSNQVHPPNAVSERQSQKWNM